MSVSRRLHVALPVVAGETVVLGDAERRHAKVLRLHPGIRVELFDGEGGAWEADILEMGFDRLVVSVVGALRERPGTEPALALTLAQGLARGGRMDEVVRHGTELGVHAFVPVLCRRSTRRDGNLRRWRDIARDAVRQSGRYTTPRVGELVDLDGLLAMDLPEHRWLLHPPEDGIRPLAEALPASLGAAVLLVGPEGGLEFSEVQRARRGGFEPVSLGPRILRTETAGLAAVAAIQALVGDMGPRTR